MAEIPGQLSLFGQTERRLTEAGLTAEDLAPVREWNAAVRGREQPARPAPPKRQVKRSLT